MALKKYAADEIKKVFSECVKKLIEKEKTIIRNDINERTIAHRLALYLENKFNGYDVDVEYNRNMEKGWGEPKYASIVKDAFYEAYRLANEKDADIKDFIEQVTAYPDVIVHKRGNNDHNLLIVEIKKNNNRSNWKIDLKKLEAFTRQKNDEGYGYTLGVHLIVFTDHRWKSPLINWYVNGHEENKEECGA